MEANPVFTAIANAVPAAQPAQEYCLLWIDWWPICMTKAEWSGWVQALGAILALAIAIALPYFQRRRADLDAFDLARQCLLMQCALISALLTNAKTEGGSAALKSALKPCETLVLLYRGVRPPRLSLSQTTCWLLGQTTTVQLSDLIAQARAGNIADADIEPALGLLMADSEQQLEGFGLKPASMA